MNWLVKGAHIVSPADGLDGQADLLVVEGRVSKVGSDLVAGGAEIMEANGLLLLPGLVDLHAHFGEPGLEQRETLVTGSAAACRGGYTTVLMMPDTLPPLDTPAAVAGAVARSTQAVVRVRVAGALTQALAGEAMPELAGWRRRALWPLYSRMGRLAMPGCFAISCSMPAGSSRSSRCNRTSQRSWQTV